MMVDSVWVLMFGGVAGKAFLYIALVIESGSQIISFSFPLLETVKHIFFVTSS